MEFFKRLTLQEIKHLVIIQYKFSCDSIYNIPTTFRRKGAAMGYGKKSDFTKDLTCSPGSSKYRLDTLFDKNSKSKKGFSMY